MSTFDRQAILESLSRLVTPGIKLTALADELGVRKHDYETLRSTVLELVEEGSVHVLPGGAFAQAPHGRTPAPHAKPVPPPPPQPRAHKKARHKRRAREQEAPKRARKAELPWKTPAAPARPLSQPAEEFDPETGEMRPTGTGKLVVKPMGKPVPVKPATRGAPVVRREDDNRPIGRITVHPAGYGFVATPDGTVFVPAKYRSTTLDGAEVALDTWPGVRGAAGGEIEVRARA